MAQPVLEIIDLDVQYDLKDSSIHAVKKVNLTIGEGDNVGIIGESGSGKSSVAAAIMRCPCDTRRTAGKILYQGVDLLSLSEKEFDRYRWVEIAMVFQNSLDILDPIMPVGEQIAECIQKHMKLSGPECTARVAEVIEQVQLPAATAKLLPHQLSGGMRQRMLVAMAISCKPRLLIADEPTSAVDEENKQEIAALLRRLQQEMGLTLIVVSHEIQTVASLADHIAVMYGGCLMETGITAEILHHARHPYTRGLLSSCTQIHPYRDLWGIAESSSSVPEGGCPFLNRCPQAVAACEASLPILQEIEDEPDHCIACHCGGIMRLLEAKHISKAFHNGKQQVQACDDCGFSVYYGEVVSVIGKSGADKSTLAMICAGIDHADSGEVIFCGKPLRGNSATSVRGGLQIIFQDPFSSVNGRMSVYKAISEPLRIQKDLGNEDLLEIVRRLLRDVGLPDTKQFYERPCNTLSGGQRQRISIARALAMEPKLLIADEICSMLDTSTQANLLRLLKGLQQKEGLGVLFITHDELLSKKIADRVFCIDKGKMIEIDDSTLMLDSTNGLQ